MTHAIERLDDTVHQRVRLGVLTVLDEVREAEFNYLQTELGLTPGNLSRHLAVLADAGYVTIKKTIVDLRSRTWVRITRAGRSALSEELTALRELLAAHERAQKRQ